MGNMKGDAIKPLMDAVKDFPKHVRPLAHKFRELGLKQTKNKSKVNDADKYDGSSNGPNNSNGPGSQNNQNDPRLVEYDVGTFKELKSRAEKGDEMQHDHIPSFAALKRAKEKELGRKLTPDDPEFRELYDNAVTVELSDAMHKAGRTWGSKNKPLYEADSDDLAGAMNRDLAALRTNMQNNTDLSDTDIDLVLNEIRNQNALRGIK